MANWPLWQSLSFLRKKPDEVIMERLRAVPVFDNVSDRELKYIKGMCHARQYAEGEQVFRMGDPGVGLFVILDGNVEIYVEGQDFRETFAVLKEGDFFGELALLVDMPRTASAISRTFTRVVCFSRIDLLSVTSRRPRLGTKILSNMARLIGLRLVLSNRELEKLRRAAGHKGTTIEGGQMMDPD